MISHWSVHSNKSLFTTEQRQVKKLALHLGPRPDAEIHIPVVSPSEQLSSQKICFSSYLERMGKLRRDKDGVGGLCERFLRDSYYFIFRKYLEFNEHTKEIGYVIIYSIVLKHLDS